MSESPQKLNQSQQNLKKVVIQGVKSCQIALQISVNKNRKKDRFLAPIEQRIKKRWSDRNGRKRHEESNGNNKKVEFEEVPEKTVT